MSEHLSGQILERYHQHKLSPVELIEADDHLAVCERCRRQLYDGTQAQASLSLLAADFLATGLFPEHLSYEQLAAYVDEGLGATDREIAEAHLQLCSECALRRDELRAFATQIADTATQEYLPAAQSAPPEKRAIGWWENFVSFWRVPALPLTFRLAGVGAFAALLFWLGAMLWSQIQHTAVPQKQIANQQQPSPQSTVAPSPVGTPEVQPSEAPQTAVIRLNDGKGQIAMDKDGHLTGVLPPYEQTIKQALSTQRIETPARLNALTGKAGLLMGAAEEGHPFALLSPVGTFVQGARPQFRWRALAGAESYVVKIYDADFNEVAVSPSLTDTNWQASSALPRGRVYSWQVTARTGDKEILSPVKPAPDAKFMILEQAKVQELAQAQKAAAGSPLTLGILYAQTGLLDDAERELQTLLRANPQSPLAQKLLRSVRAKRQK